MLILASLQQGSSETLSFSQRWVTGKYNLVRLNFNVVSIVSLIWSSTVINWVTIWSRFLRVNVVGPVDGFINLSKVSCFADLLPSHASSIAFQIGCGIVQWCSGMFSALHCSWYSLKCCRIWARQDELLPVWNTFHFPSLSVNATLSLCSLWVVMSSALFTGDLPAWLAPASLF